MKLTGFFAFREGSGYVNARGLPATCYFLLSSRAAEDFKPDDRLEDGNLGEITGTGYARIALPSPNWHPPWTSKTYEAYFGRLLWTTGTARDWPSDVRSVVLVTSPDNSEGVAVVAWNLREGGLPRDFSDTYKTQKFFPVLSIENRTLREKAGTES